MKYIICPQCGAEYHPAEIFIPDYILGKPKDIIKDENKRIISVNGLEQDLEETYICDKCNTKFKVLTKLDFTTKVVPKLENTTKISLRKYSMTMEER